LNAQNGNPLLDQNCAATPQHLSKISLALAVTLHRAESTKELGRREEKKFTAS
jgi:hypothetical protein